jgi:hypothetical protein
VVAVIGLAAMREPLEASLDDAKGLIRKRAFLGTLLALAALPVAGLLASYTHDLRTVVWIGAAGTWALGFLYYADAMRLVFEPHYKLTALNVLKLLGIIFIMLGLVVLTSLGFAAAIARLPLAAHTLYLLRQAAFYVLLIYFGTKLAFACFALKDRGVFSACGRSWMLATGATFLPTFVVMGMLYILQVVTNPAFWAIHLRLAPWAYVTLNIVTVYTTAILVGAFIYPFLARWMVECEALRTPAAIVPPYGGARP